MNCWDYMKCGREEGGSNADELGVCPAYPDHGRDCWKIAGTFYRGGDTGHRGQKEAELPDLHLVRHGGLIKSYEAGNPERAVTNIKKVAGIEKVLNPSSLSQ